MGAQDLRPLIAQFNALLERLRQMGAFKADVAHELNTPLTTRISSGELVSEVVEFHEDALQEAGLQVRIQGDACLLRRALSNLLGNTTSYATPQSMIELQIACEKCLLRLAVRNVGPQIDAAHLPRLFDRVYRCDASRAQADRNL